MKQPGSARKNQGDSESGAAAVEFALVLPVLLIVLLGIIEFGAAYNAQLLLTNAAREAARSYSITADETAAVAAASTATEVIGLPLTASDIDFAVTPNGVCSSPAMLTVTVTVQKPLLTGFFGATLPLSGKATRQCGG
ncbi:Flp pilus assembly protein TadG [Microbacteriaceae bacterium SG_E_30_P1]|uniref:Flp pilus assembly protein TadG n=1 Tax=Antiquaquibacter oligotrophicus TaxID=2880260 RepID=A0ABT6KQN4_9MICO|nr:TadE family protein [Antiquaquibacter oligotrophicus]MDH6182295.1 Flp pilus assembly protein TadG [Antiquaquibacter oligotrophicus]UDF12049.1 pilus assembly protein [Antiquaquibacter oligotrophicus]